MNINDLTGEVIGAAIEVHKHLGPGLLESAYEECLCHELRSREIIYERQKALPINYKQVKLDCGYRLDLVVEGKVILELKSCEKIEDIHKAQLLTYLRLSGLRLGLILNFNVRIMKEGIVSVVNNLEEQAQNINRTLKYSRRDGLMIQSSSPDWIIKYNPLRSQRLSDDRKHPIGYFE